MKIVCDACSAKYSIADEKVRGKVFKIRCKKCSNIIVVRGAVSDAAEPSAPHSQKEMKVLDYAGHDGKKPADRPVDAPEEAVWHLVIDQEQVGPMTVDEVQERFQRGEVDSDGYVWREGFGDWERLADVDVFAEMVAGARAYEGGTGGLFGSGGAEVYDDGRGGQSDPADLFAARGAGDDAGAGVDLFAGTGLSGAAVDEGAGDTDALFAVSGGTDMSMDSDTSIQSVAAATSLTGQRNENSVLFSLNNLAALASDAPRANSSSTAKGLAATPGAPGSASSSSLASVSSPGGGAGEGSGLIDIRSMAQVYLGESKTSTKAVGSADDLPVFSQTAFEAASPVLLPNVQPAVNNRLLFALVGLIGVLVVAAVVLVVIVLRGGDDAPRTASAESAPAAQSGGVASAPSAAGSASSPAPSATSPAAGATAGESGTPPAGTPPGGESAAGSGGTTASAGVATEQDTARRRERTKAKERGERTSDRQPTPREQEPAREVAPAPAAPPPDPLETSGCDEVTCLVDPDKPCCKKGGRRSGSGSSGSRSESVDPSLPERPSRADVASGIGNVKGSVSSCGSRAAGAGKVTVKIKISPAGTVSSVAASGGNPSLNGCVESAVRRAKFPRSQFGASVNYPFIF